MVPSQMIMHATTLDFDGYGILLKGASGAGKSSLALQLMALGMHLVADDRTELTAKAKAIVATAPTAINGLIEARGIGLLNVDCIDETNVQLVIDLSRVEEHRFPKGRTEEILGRQLPCLRKVNAPYFPAAIRQYVIAGRREPL